MRQSSWSGFPDQNCFPSWRLANDNEAYGSCLFLPSFLTCGGLLPADSFSKQIWEPTAPWWNVVCGQLLQANLGADCSREGAQEGRGAEAAHGGDEVFKLPGLRGETDAFTIPQQFYPFVLAGVPESSSREWSQNLTSQKAVIFASERGVEWE